MIDLKNIDLVLHAQNTLSVNAKNLSTESLIRECWGNVNSKYRNKFNIEILKTQPSNSGIVAITNSGGNLSITLHDLQPSYEVPSLEIFPGYEIQVKESETFNIGESDVLMFPSTLKYDIVGDNGNVTIFSITEKQIPGDGKTQYRVEVTFSDTYFLIVNADSDNEAKEIAYDVDMSYWDHEWPNPLLEKIHGIRKSRWGKSSMKAYKL